MVVHGGVGRTIRATWALRMVSIQDLWAAASQAGSPTNHANIEERAVISG